MPASIKEVVLLHSWAALKNSHIEIGPFVRSMNFFTFISSTKRHTREGWLAFFCRCRTACAFSNRVFKVEMLPSATAAVDFGLRRSLATFNLCAGVTR